MTTRTQFDMAAMPLDLHVGTPVRVLSGRVVGQVAAIAGNRFRLTAGGEDVWLTQDAIFTADVGCVTLACELEGLHRYRGLAVRA